jgi:molybdopterin-biosynthesis enzyme MoeA-like protein
MAKLPEGSIALTNREGSAPGVLITTLKSKVVAMPGVPREMKSIMTNEVFPLMERDLSTRFQMLEEWFGVVGVGESRLVPVVLRLTKKYSPAVYIKTHPTGFKNGKTTLDVQIIATFQADGPKHMKDDLQRISQAIKREVRRLGGVTVPDKKGQ